MEKSSLAEVKAILKSLVLSSIDKMTIDQLNRDYRDIEGEYIPFRRLGYASIEQFLHAIPDTLRIFGSGPTALVCFMADEKSVHIHEMIMQQKKPKTKAKSRTRTRNNTCMSTSNKYNHNMQQVFTTGHQLSPFQSVNRQHAVRTVKLSSAGPLVTNNFKGKIDSNPVLSTLPQPNCIVTNDAHRSEPLKANYNLQKCKDIDNVSNLMKTNLVITQPSPSPPSPPPPLVRKVKKFNNDTNENVNDLNRDYHPNGMTPPTIAPTKTNNLLENIKPPAAKQKSLAKIEKLASMRKHINFSNSNQEYVLSSTSEEAEKKDPQKPTETIDLKLIKERNKLFDVNNESEEQCEEAVPAFAAKLNVFRVDFPKYIASFDSKIEPYKIPDDIAVGSCIKIFVSEIHSPFKFWFHINKGDNELDSLMYRIERYYLPLDENELRIPLTCLIPGQVCAAKFNEMWHRAEIVAPPTRNTVKVTFMDYGTVSEVKVEEIKFLVSSFAKLPAQAARGCLSHIKPRQRHWSHEATLHFLRLTSDQMVFAQISEIDAENQTLYMIICNTNGDEIVQVNKSLVKERYAFFNEEWKTEKIQKNNGRRLHHPREDFPTFSMIELGEYPNFNELFKLKHHGIDYEAIHDVIIYNQSSILNKHEHAPEFIRKLPYFLMTTNPFRSEIILDLYATKSWAV